VSFALQDFNRAVAVLLINKPVDFINTPAPAIAVAQGFRLSDAVIPIPGNIFE
jgi:hypothetical protein